MKKYLITAVIGLLGIVGASCTPHEIAVFKTLNQEQQNAVVRHIQSQQASASSSRDCNQAIDRHWPGDKRRAKQVVWRESRNNPAAANPRSSARGCMQLMHSIHAHRYRAVGCSTNSWKNADCNVRAAATLYREAGWTPWRATAY